MQISTQIAKQTPVQASRDAHVSVFPAPPAVAPNTRAAPGPAHRPQTRSRASTPCLPAHVIVDASLRVLDHDEAAARLFDDSTGMLQRIGDRLRLRADDAQRALSAAVLAGAAATACERPRRLTDALRFQMCPMQRNSANGRREQVYLIVFTAPPRNLRIADVAARHGLSPTESKVLEALCTDSRLKDYALSHRLSMHTARTQLRSILAKLGVHSQIEAVRLVLQDIGTPAIA